MKTFIAGLLLLALGGVGWLYFNDPMMQSRVTTQRAVKPTLPKATNGPNRGWRDWDCPQSDAVRGFTACAEFRGSNGKTFTAQRHSEGWYEIEFYVVAGKLRRRYTISDGAITSAVEQKSQTTGWEVTENLPLSLNEPMTAQLWQLEQFKGWQGITPMKEKRSAPKRPEQ